jgi:hypothetical protein
MKQKQTQPTREYVVREKAPREDRPARPKPRRSLWIDLLDERAAPIAIWGE